MAKYNIDKLGVMLSDEVRRFTSEPSVWCDFLKCSASNYKYSFRNQVMIFLQRPDAVACADFDTWNKRLHRYIQKGSKGIAIFNEIGNKVNYVFDVSDTKSLNDEPLTLWDVNDESGSYVLDLINSAHMYNCTSFEDAIVTRIEELVSTGADLYLSEGDMAESEAFVNAFYKCVKDSCCAAVLRRCGFDDASDSYMNGLTESSLNGFDSDVKIYALGTAVSAISSVLLREIERDVREFQNEKNINKTEVQSYGNDIQTGERLYDSGHSRGRENNEHRQDGDVKVEISSSQQTNLIYNAHDEGRAGESSDGNRQGSENTDATVNRELSGEKSGSFESGESYSVDAAHELSAVDGGGSSQEGTDIPLDNVLFPTVEKQLEIIEDAVESNSNFEISQEDIDAVLARGSLFADGKFRIYSYFQEKHTVNEKAEFLKNEYGSGGGTMFYPDGVRGSADHDAKGLKIIKYGSFTNPDLLLNWNKVQKRIGELIKDGHYLNQKELDEYPQYKAKIELRAARFKIGSEYISLVHNYNDYLRDNDNVDSMLNQYVLVDCGSCFIDGRLKTAALSFEGDLILPLMRESLTKIINSEAPFKERAENLLNALSIDVLENMGFIGAVSEEAEESKYVSVPNYKVGDLFFDGATKYSIVEISKASVYVSDVDFELNSLELPITEFERKVIENPSNNHLVQKVKEEDYNAKINHAIAVIDEVEHSLLPDDELNIEVVELVQVGDFYEVRGENAKRVADALELMTTRKTLDDDTVVDVCGFPTVHFDRYNERLIEKGLVLRAPALSEEYSESSDSKGEAIPRKRNALIARNYDALNRLAPGILNGDYTSLLFQSNGFEPLLVSNVGDEFISIMHYYEQNGDRMSDPDVVVRVDYENKLISAASYEMSSLGIYREYIDFDEGEIIDINGQKETNGFLSQWFKNIEQQNYVLVRGKTRDGETVYFDKSGNEISEDSAEGIKAKYQVRLYRPYNAPDTVKAYVSEVHATLEPGHIIDDEREVFEYREAAENSVDNFHSVFDFDEEFRAEQLARVPEPVLHRYYSAQRPVGPGTFPDIADNKPVNIVNFEEREFQPNIDRAAWGYLEFEHPLTEKQAEDYELVKAPFIVLTDGYAEPVVDEQDKIAVRMQLDGNDDNGIFVYIERNDIPCPDDHVELGVFDTEDAALKFCSYIDKLLDTDDIYRQKQLNTLSDRSISARKKEVELLKPIVYCEWSEHNSFEDEKEFPFVEFNALMKKLDDEVVKLKEEYRARNDYYPYFKTKFVIRFPDGYEYTGRQDIGDGDGSLLDHVRYMSEDNLKRIKEDGYGGLYKGEERTAAIQEFETFLNVYLPLLENEVKEYELSYDKEAYKLGYGHLGNGITVWNSADIDKEADDYRTVAHISDDGMVKFYADDLPEGVKAEINASAINHCADYIRNITDMSEEKFKYWYFNQMLSVHPTYVPGKDFNMSDYVHCYKALHSDDFVRDVDVSLLIQLENISSNKHTYISQETKKDVLDKVRAGEISSDEVSATLKGIDVSKINNEDDVYDVLANKFVDEAADVQKTVKSSNYKIHDYNLGVGGPKEKYRNNVAAIKLLNQLESEGRQAAQEEQEVLSKYVGWGGLANAFDVNNSAWAQEYKELQELLTTEEYRSAKASTLTSFYTPPVVIEAIYDGLRNLGFKRGNVLEPSCGIGNFFGMLPKDFADSNLFGVELDGISGRIAKQLYPEAKIAVKGYEDTKFKDGFFDVAIGNVPFNSIKVHDKGYNHLNFFIHDYFFAKTLDKVRPGGVIAFVTSKGTLDKQNPAVRKYIAQRAELLGAIRLPNNTFTDNAGTSPTSDIIFLKKRDKAIEIEPDWVHLGFTDNGLPINSYFVEHPEMVLGHMEIDRVQYGREDTVCVPNEGVSLKEQLNTAIRNIKGQIAEQVMDFDTAIEDTSSVVKSIPADPDVRNFSYTIVDGDIYYRVDDEMVKQELGATPEQRVRGLIELRDCVRRLIDLQRYNYSDYEIEAEQRRLNKLYDEYTAKYGLINSRGNSMAFEDDSSYYLLCSLENVNEQGELISKADMFTKRTIKPHVPVVSVGTASEALSVCISEKAHVDLDFMSRLADMSKEKIIEELQGVIYRVPGEEDYNGEPIYVTSDEYLSGNVREKLKVAEMAAATDQSFAINVMALEKVIPKDLEPHEISLRLGSTWVPEDIVNEFMWQLLDTPKGYRSSEPDIKAHYSEINGAWTVENKHWYGYGVKASSTYGTKRISAYEIIFNTLNLKTVEIYDYDVDINGKRTRTLNKNETIVAQQKQELIKNEFLNWVWQDPERRQRLVRIYNDKFNNIKLREYNGEHLVFEGMNPDITLMEHQKNAIAHAIYGGNTLLAHEVGAGKTFEMTAIAMESKRLGLCSKSLMVVPNHLIGQWASEFYQLYPSANLLVATKKDFEPANRKKFCSRIATGDYDAVIIGHSQFEKIPLSIELQSRFIEEEIFEIEEGIRELEAQGGDSTSVKSLERTKKSLELRLEKLSDIEQDDVVTFEELGVDKIFIDEAHYFKNLFLYTKMHNVAGISQTEAKKSSDLYMKTRYLNDLTGSKGVIFATGTPISNTMAEAFTMQRYLQYYTLKQNGMLHFDAWASIFGEVVTAVELAPEGTGYRAKTRFAKFHNIPELMTLFKLVADIKTGDDLNLPKPEAEFHVVQTEPSAFQEQIVESLGKRAKDVRDRKVEPTEDNMLKITNDGRLLGLDQRCFDDTLPDDENSKVNKAVENIYDIWEEYKDDRLAQLVFCDLSTPKGNGEFSIYEDVKQKLIAKGVPEKEIAFIHDAKTDVQKDKLFAKVRSGEVRVLMGSTFKMGAGTNVQDKLIALHDLDCPWRPSDLEQRLGRILRQGNQQEKVQVYRYVTKGTFDAYLWQLVENKQKFISQIMTSKSPVRIADDIDDTALSYAEIKSLCIKDPRIKEKMELDIDVTKLKLLKGNFMSQKYRLEDAITFRYPKLIRELEQSIIGCKADIQLVKDCTIQSDESEFSPMVIKGVKHTEKKPAGEALLSACREIKDTAKVEIGEYRGFKLLVQYDPFHSCRILYLKGALSHSVELGKSDLGNIVRIDNVLAGLEGRLNAMEEKLHVVRSELATAKVEVQKEFSQEQELNTKLARLEELDAMLRMDEKGDGDNSKEEQVRSDKDGLDSVLSNAYSRAGQNVPGSAYEHGEKDIPL